MAILGLLDLHIFAKDTLSADGFVPESGHLYLYRVGLPIPWLTPSDSIDGPNRSSLIIYEDGVPQGPAHSLHNVIRSDGVGKFSHWGKTIYLSASDNSDPRTNGRTYTVRYPVGVPSAAMPVVVLTFLTVLIMWFVVRWGPGSAALFLASTLVTLMVSDHVIRLMHAIPKIGYGVWAGYPGSVQNLVSEPDRFQAIHRYNRYGFRGEDFPLEPDGIRVAGVGDSYTEGVGALEEESWPAHLSYSLSETKAEVINLGKAGASPETYARIISEVAVPLKPTDIIVAFNASDLRFGPALPDGLTVNTEFDDPFLAARSAWAIPFATLFKGWTYLLDRTEKHWPYMEGPYWNPYDQNYFGQAVTRLARLRKLSQQKARELAEARLEQVSENVLQSSRERRFNPSLIEISLVREFATHELTTDDMEVPTYQLETATREWLTWYASTGREHGIRLWLLYYPQAPLVTRTKAWGPLNEAWYAGAPDVFGDTSVRDLFRHLCDDLKIPFIDATEILTKHAGEPLYLRYDTHPNGRAHKLVAQLVAERMRSHLSVPPQREKQ